MEFIVPSLRIEGITGLSDMVEIDERLAQLVHLVEDQFLARFH